MSTIQIATAIVITITIFTLAGGLYVLKNKIKL